MLRELDSVAGDMLKRWDNGTFDNWSRTQLSKRIPYPWKPTRKLPTGHAEKQLGLVEFIGLSGSGKSTTLKYLSEVLNTGGTELRIMREPEGEKYVPRDGNLQSFLGANLLIAMAKIGNTLRAMEQMTDAQMLIYKGAAENPNKNNVLPKVVPLIERGVNDALGILASDSALARLYDPKFRNVSDHILGTNYQGLWFRVFFMSLVLAQVAVKEVIVMGVSREESDNRRIARGDLPRGRLVNEYTRPHLEGGYGWWLGSIYPLLREKWGTGLLVVDGDDGEDYNHGAVLSFIKESYKLS